jgi:hypothetical protein
MNGQVVPNINNNNFIRGSATAGTFGGSATSNGVGAHTHTFISSTIVADSGHTHGMAHTHQWGHVETGASDYLHTLAASNPANGGITAGDDPFLQNLAIYNGTGATKALRLYSGATSVYTSGVIDPPFGGAGATAATDVDSANTTVSGTTDSSGSSFAIIPPYISAVYLMRIK